MKMAIMQPYFCPHIGYFQLVNLVDTFVFYDDVQYIRRGYINRNTLKNNLKFTIPVSKAPRKSKINEIAIHPDSDFFDKLIISLERLYSTSPNYNSVMGILNSIFNKNHRTISELAIDSVKAFSKFIGISTSFKKSSEMEYEKTSDRSLNLINICKSQNCSKYINPIGGTKLYDKGFFSERGVELNFINTQEGLSIIDICMFNDLHSVRQTLNGVQLI